MTFLEKAVHTLYRTIATAVDEFFFSLLNLSDAHVCMHKHANFHDNTPKPRTPPTIAANINYIIIPFPFLIKRKAILYNFMLNALPFAPHQARRSYIGPLSFVKINYLKDLKLDRPKFWLCRPVLAGPPSPHIPTSRCTSPLSSFTFFPPERILLRC